MKKIRRSITVLLAALMLLILAIPADALDWDGSTTVNGPGGSAASDAAYGVANANYVYAWRFSVVDMNGNTKCDPVDIYVSAHAPAAGKNYASYASGDTHRAYYSRYKFEPKLNKRQIIAADSVTFNSVNNLNSDKSFTDPRENGCFAEADFKFADPLPKAPDAMGGNLSMEEWQAKNVNLNPVLKDALGIPGGISGLDYLDKVIVEPVYAIMLNGVNYCATVTEMAVFGRLVCDEKYIAERVPTHVSDSKSFFYVAQYPNYQYANALYTENVEEICAQGTVIWKNAEPVKETTGGKIKIGSKTYTCRFGASFGDIINKGYGVGICYTQDAGYVIRYDSNGGAGSMDAQPLKMGQSAELLPNRFYNGKLEFTGWNTRPDGSGASYNDSQTVSDLAPAGGEITLYAQWKEPEIPVSYTIKFDPNGAARGSMDPLIFLKEELPKELPANAFEWPGHAFSSWECRDTGKLFSDKETLEAGRLADLGLGSGGGETTLYAKWDIIDLELYDIVITDSDNTVLDRTKLVPGSSVKIYYRCRNNSDRALSASVYRENREFINTYAIPAHGTADVFAGTRTITDQDVSGFALSGGIYIAGHFGDTSQEINGENNVKNVDCNAEIEKLVLELKPIAPNASYREKTSVISSFNIINESGRDCLPSDNVDIRFRVYKADGKTLITEQFKRAAAVPAGGTNLIYFKWTVPSGLGGKNVIVEADILQDGSYGKLVSNARKTCSYAVYQTPDTDYEASMPEGFVRPSVPQSGTVYATWSEWVYSGGRFVKKNYGAGLAPVSGIIDSATGSTAVYSGERVVQIKSGYGIGFTVSTDIICGVKGYSAAPASSCTAVQYALAQYPEYRYGGPAANVCTTMEISGKKALLPEFGSYGRYHFTPIWYPDGSYEVSVLLSDFWTPAGMLSARSPVAHVSISGSAYDDWYNGGR